MIYILSNASQVIGATRDAFALAACADSAVDFASVAVVCADSAVDFASVAVVCADAAVDFAAVAVVCADSAVVLLFSIAVSISEKAVLKSPKKVGWSVPTHCGKL